MFSSKIQFLLDLSKSLEDEKNKLEEKLEYLVDSCKISDETKPSVFLLLTESIEKYVELDRKLVLAYKNMVVEELLENKVDEETINIIKEKLLG